MENVQEIPSQNIQDTSTSVPSSPSPEVHQPVAQPEKMLTQTQVDDIVKKVKSKYSGYENNQTPNVNQNQNVNLDEVRRIAAEEASKKYEESINNHQKNLTQQEAEKTASQFFNKLNEQKVNYPDFDEKVGDFLGQFSNGIADISDIVLLANSVDNTAGIFYELQQNPVKIAHFRELMKVSPQLALKDMKKLSDSISINEQAKKSTSVHEPLSQIKPSPTTGSDSGSMSVSDFKKMFKNRRR